MEAAQPDRLIGIVTRSDVLKAQHWVLEEEERRERVLTLALLAAGRRGAQHARQQKRWSRQQPLPSR
jgi:hypothetical protein